MLSRTSAEDGSGRRGAAISLSARLSRWLVVAALIVAVPIVIALVVTKTTGPLFDVWGWAEVALILLLAETVILLTLGMYRGEHNPYRSVMPGASHWAMHSNDPQVLYAGTLRAPMSADARISSNARPLLLAIAPALAALVMLGVVIAGSSGDADAGTAQPASLPIVEIKDNVSVMLETVELDADQMTLTFQINDLQWGSSRHGYQQLRADDVTYVGPAGEQPGFHAAGFMTIDMIVKPGINSTIAWRLMLYLNPPADPTQPTTVTLHTLRTVPSRDIPDLPQAFDGDWSFTFVPAEV
jgi:hypothetical protein